MFYDCGTDFVLCFMYEHSNFRIMKKRILFLISLFAVTALYGDTLTLRLPQAIAMACERSYDARSARHTFLAAEWSYKFYKANYLPSVSLSSTPSLNRVISKITQPDGTASFVEQNQLSSDVALSITQNVALTGGQFFLKSSLQRQDELSNRSTAYNSQPVIIGYQQSLFGYNSLKWERRLEPLRYEAALKNYTENMELIASRACSYFFSLASAQTELFIAQYNYASADTLSRYARGRYGIGTITESEMLQLELNKITAEANVLSAQSNLENAMTTLRSYLAIDKGTTVTVESDSQLPSCKADVATAIALARAHSPEPVSYELRRREVKSSLAQAKANAGLKADLYIQLGLSQTADNLADSYRSPQNMQYAGIGVSLPLLDWGRGRGRVKIAESNAELVEIEIERAATDFEINVARTVGLFNLQAHRVQIAEKSAALAQQRYEVARHMYIMGKATILDLNAAITEKDAAQRGRINALSYFWNLYYGLRSMTGGKIFENQ